MARGDSPRAMATGTGSVIEKLPAAMLDTRADR